MVQLLKRGIGELSRFEEDVEHIRSGSLQSWISVPSIYPTNFQLEYVERKGNDLFAVGRDLVYKFHDRNHLDNSRTGFRKNWRAACEEFAAHELIAPGLYVGLRVFHWVQGVPIWCEYEPRNEFHPLRPPTDGNDVCFVLRRPRVHRSLLELAQRSPRESIVTVRAAARALHRFHKAKENVARREPGRELKLFDDRMLEDHRQFSDADGLSGALIMKLRLALMRKNENAMRLLRGERERYRTVLHGNFGMHSVYLSEDAEEKNVSLLGYKWRASERLIGDAMYDLARFATDCTLRGYRSHAQPFLSTYISARDGDFFSPELHEYFSLQVLLEQLLMRNEPVSSRELGAVLSLAFDMQTPVLFVCEEKRENSNDFAFRFGQALGAEQLDLSSVAATELDRKVVAENQSTPALWALFEKLLTKSDEILSEGSHVCISLPHVDREFVRLLLGQRRRSQTVMLSLLTEQAGRSGIIAQQPQLLEAKVPFLFYEPTGYEEADVLSILEQVRSLNDLR